MNALGMKKKKLVMDKISGQNNIDKRWEEQDKVNKLSTLEEIQLQHQNMLVLQANNSKATKRQVSNLDAYIDLILKNGVSMDEFLYLVRNSIDDPYDLEITDYGNIIADKSKFEKGGKKQKSKEGGDKQIGMQMTEIREYYTVSKKGLCHFVNHKPIEFIPLANFIRERETYDEIKSLKFFSQFRKWKTLKMWRKNIIKYQQQQTAQKLEDKLFYLHPILSNTLLQHRAWCCEMEKLRFLDMQSQSYSITVDVPSIDQFKANQEKKMRQINESIQEYSARCRQNIRDGFQKCLEKLRSKKFSNDQDVQEESKNDQQNLPMYKETAYENLGFPDNMTYEQRSELRKECSKFIKFSYLVDFIALNSLKNIYQFSVQELLTELEQVVKFTEPKIAKEKGLKPISKPKEPLFSSTLISKVNNQLSDNDLEIQIVQEFLTPPIGNSEKEEFNMIVHLQIEEEKKKEEEEGEKKEKEKHDLDDPVYEYKKIKNISHQWMEIQPSSSKIIEDVSLCVTNGLESLLSFERWSRHDEMTAYVNVLEEWDDTVCGDWESPESNQLQVEDWLEQSPKEAIEPQVKAIVHQAFNNIISYMTTFKSFLDIYWHNSQVDLEIFKHPKMINPADGLLNSLNLLYWQKEYLDKEIPYIFDLGLLRVDCSGIKETLCPSPQKLIDQFMAFIPGLLRQQNEEIQNWLNSANRELKYNSGTIEDFVKQQNSLQSIENTFPIIREQFSVLFQQYIICQDNKFDIKKDDENNFSQTQKIQKELEQGFQNASDSQEKNLETFAQKINKSLIPELQNNIQEITNQAQDNKYLDHKIGMDVAIAELTQLQEQFTIQEEASKKYNYYQQTLRLEETEFEDVVECKLDLKIRLDMWTHLRDWKKYTSEWIDGRFINIDTEVIRNKANLFSVVVNKASKKLVANPVLDELREAVFSFKETMPIVMALRNKYLKNYHWDKIKAFMNQDFDIEDQNFTLRSLMDMNVLDQQTNIQNVATQATQEDILERNYNALDKEWRELKFEFIEYQGDQMNHVYLLSKIDDLYQVIDELLANFNNILGSKYLSFLRTKAEASQDEIIMAQQTIDDWLSCQKSWIYLENIFSSSDIKKKLAAESQQFEIVDTFFKKKTKTCYNTKFVSRIITNSLAMQFKQYKDYLNNIQKALENFLEVKKVSFPRFYFVSSDDLLEILAKSNDLQAIQKHIKKCFDNIALLDFGEDPRNTHVQGMISHEKEKVEFYKYQGTNKVDIEIWLKNVEEEMRVTLKRKMRNGKSDYEQKDRKEWVLCHPGQVVATISQYYWTNQTEAYMSMMEVDEKSMWQWLNINYIQLEGLLELIREGLTSIPHKIIVALITVDVHNRDIIQQLVGMGIDNPINFNWQQQLKYYWDESAGVENIVARQVNATLRYGFEYMGATSRLVITPLTDKCWITITGALNIKLGAAPAGPAGTGKTESTKDLAKALGVLCIVFNCSEQIGFKVMQNLFSGLAQQGAWACLDEFNRIDIEVLSVIAQQLRSIRTALLKNEKDFFFMVSQIILDPSIGVFITMNPGYAGRTELPDNLKVLFRQVSMMIPYYGLIAEIMLYAEGFQDAQPLSEKMRLLYKLSCDQLSQQKHYDFGLRAVKSVLNMAGSLKRADPTQNEDQLLIRAMCDSNIPKFLKEDVILFKALINDLFPEAQIQVVDYGHLITDVNSALAKKNLQKLPNLVTKVLQLYDTFNVRFGVMLVGETGSGKTTCYEILSEVMTKLRADGHPDQKFQKVTTNVLNPKCITMGELFGDVNEFTKEWQDGLASMIMRDLSMRDSEDANWVVFDGPVDAMWIENMNTVLDDNMMLCLANGQRIKLRPQMKMLFEVQDLAVASPATVSRCGMVYLISQDLGWQPYVISWINKFYGEFDPTCPTLSEYQTKYTQPPTYTSTHLLFTPEDFDYELRLNLYNLFETTIDPFLTILRTPTMKEPIKTTNLQLVVSLCHLLEALVNIKYGFRLNMKQVEKQRYLNYSYIFAFIWSMGASVYDQCHQKVDLFIKNQFQSIIFPSNDDVYGFYFDQTSLNYQPWSDLMSDYEFKKEVPYFQMMVPTVDTTSNSYIIRQLLINRKQIYLTGQTGTGKSVLLTNLFNQVKDADDIDPANLMFSAKTSSLVTQSSIESKLKVLKKSLLGAKPGRQVAIFIDDINMPSVVLHSQPPIELLRLIVDRGGVYDRKELYWKKIQDTIIVACSAPPEGGRNNLTQRFTSKFNILCYPQANVKVLYKIFFSLLDGFLSTGFTDSVRTKAGEIVDATIEMYNKILEEKLPIPSKFHYTFNLRDVSKVIQGVLMVKPNFCKEGDQVIRLWIHEVSRVFHDRLVNEEDRTWFKESMIDLLKSQFRVTWNMEDVFGDKLVMFSDLLKLDFPEKTYEEVKDVKKLIKVLDDKLDEYNAELTPMKLVFFSDAIQHILRIVRVLRQPRGNMMLIGVGGCGKQSLTKLSSYLYQFNCSSIEITKNFNLTNFREFMQIIMMECGVKAKQSTFLFTDAQITDEAFLEDINNLLNSGDIPNLWEPEQKKKIEDDLRQVNEKLGRPGDPDMIYATFVERVRDNLHIILCMSPVGEALRVRCRQFPALVNCCNLDWFSSWPEEALLSVATTLFADFQFENDHISKSIVSICKEIHLNSNDIINQFQAELKRKVFITPKSYLDLINLYIDTLSKKKQEVGSNINRLQNGLTKLEQANTQIADLQINLAKLQPEIDVATENVKKLLEVLQVDSKVAREKEVLVNREVDIVNKKASEIKIIFDSVNAELAIVEPELKKAEEGVKKIDATQIGTVRGYANPPQIVKNILHGVCIMFDKKYEWAVAKQMMANLKGFIESMVNYKKETLKFSTVKKLRELKEKYPDDFKMEIVMTKAYESANICQWLNAMETVYEVNKSVNPKKQKVAEMKEKLSVAQADLDVKQAELDIVKSKVDKLQAQNKEAMDKQQFYETQKEQTVAELDRAQKLVVLLKDEGLRWLDTVSDLKDKSKYVTGDVILSCAQIGYCGPFTGPYRQKLQDILLTKCLELDIPVSDQFSTIKCLGVPMVMRDWQNWGLPSDSVSQENGIIATKGNRWPLLIDPQLQAVKWVYNMEKEHSVKVLKFKDSHFQSDMKACLSLGYPCLIEDTTESLEPLIDPILNRQLITANDGSISIRFADSDIQYDEGFRLYLTTKLPNPDYLPDIFIKTNVINFTVTFVGLEEQLLTEVMKKEQPQIEQARDQNVINLAGYVKKKTESEDNILRLLTQTKSEMLLKDDALIKTLESSKETGKEINEKIGESITMEKQIEVTRNMYTNVSKLGSTLFFVIKDLGLIDPMYQYSLQYIVRLFRNAMDQTEENSELEERLQLLMNKINEVIFTNVSRGLFEAHKLIYSFLIAASIERTESRLDNQLWNIYLRGAGVMDYTQQKPNPDPKTITQLNWDLVYNLTKKFSRFDGLEDSIINNLSQWQKWGKSEQLIDINPPDKYADFDTFEKMVLVKIFRPERLYQCSGVYVLQKLGKFYLEPPKTKIESIYEASDVKTPMIFVLSPGADPSELILKFAEESKMLPDKFKDISLGSGQGVVATQLIEEGKKEGKWVLLQNCHLSKSWMPDLEVLVAEIQANHQEIHENFRLFLTSMPKDYFPVSILQNGIKLTTEPPRGIRANMKRTIGDLDEEYMQSCNKGSQDFHKIILGLTFFHAIVQERRKFGPVGWNIRYEFNDSDLQTSLTVLQMLLNEQEQIPWDALTFVTGSINYGGRVTDDFDTRCLLSILKKFYVPAILQESYQFSECKLYFIPPPGSLSTYTQYIDKLPIQDDPGVFGMHENANINFQSQESSTMIETILNIQPREGGSSSNTLSPDQIVIQIATAQLSELPDNLDLDTAQEELFEVNDMDLLPSLTTVLIQESQRFNGLSDVIRKSLKDLIDAIQGLASMSQTLDSMYQSLLNNRVPLLWEESAYPSLKPLASWIRDFKARILFMSNWILNGNPPAYWLSGLFYPQGFLTGVLQTHARKYRIPIDKLQFSFKILDTDEKGLSSRPIDGVYIYGIYLEGATWDKKKKSLVDQLPGEMYTLMPLIYFMPKVDYVISDTDYSCPFYKTSARAGTLSTTGQSTNYVLSIDVPTLEETPDFWIQRGTAFLSQLND